ncbi:hypothetical protein PoB_004333700 [Plakobranchus ocellatus]|uniref:Uncharacterized protein n=1 Tax=Plakobranchus ocellatus TaxID=259542 RepID=A0AAV4BCZ9_9GAST|nr:hypothetical protein PoB_004333700 [Plakobranchus ocellatus]
MEYQGNIVVAECDSSTNLGIVDSESILQRTKTLQEMRESFERTFGRSPRTKIDIAKEVDTERESNFCINSTTSDTMSAVEGNQFSSSYKLTNTLDSQPDARLTVYSSLRTSSLTTDDK